MWVDLSLILWLHVAIVGLDYDGVTNQLLLSEGPTPYAISLSTDEPLPFKLGESFVARVIMECAFMWIHIEDESVARIGDWGPHKPAYMCNADKLIVDKNEYKLSNKRKDNDKEK